PTATAPTGMADIIEPPAAGPGGSHHRLQAAHSRAKATHGRRAQEPELPRPLSRRLFQRHGHTGRSGRRFSLPRAPGHPEAISAIRGSRKLLAIAAED